MTGYTSQELLYLEILDEIKIRLGALGGLFASPTSWPARLLQEFCYLQLRMICELIALGCMIAHGDIKKKNALRAYEPRKIIDIMESFGSDFYPKGISISPYKESFQIESRSDPQLSRDGLIKLWGLSGDYLHRGSAKKVIKESQVVFNLNLDPAVFWSNKIIALLENHVIATGEDKRHLLAGFKNPDGKVFIIGIKSYESVIPV